MKILRWRAYAAIPAITAILLLLAPVWQPTAFSATIILKNGTRITTDTHWEKEGYIEFSYKGLLSRVPKSDVQRIDTAPPGSRPPISESEISGDGEKDKPSATPKKAKPKPPPKKPPEKPEPTEPFVPHEETDYLPGVISAISELKKPVGFRDLHWGSSLSDFDYLERIDRDPEYGGITNYAAAGENLEFGGARLDSIVYSFWRRQLLTVTLHTADETHYKALKQESFQRFGPGRQSDENREKFLWTGGPSDRYLEFNPATGKGFLWFRDRDLWLQIRQAYPQEAP